MTLQSKVDQTIIAFRLRGHLLRPARPARRAPPAPWSTWLTSGSPRRTTSAKQELERARLAAGHLRRAAGAPQARARAHAPHLHQSHRRRVRADVRLRAPALADAPHGVVARTPPTSRVEEQTRILRKLTEAETFETTIHAKFQGQKRFSAEGGEVQLAMIEEFLELGGSLGVKEVVFGMAHRGRLNVLANIMGKPAEEIFSEIAGPDGPQGVPQPPRREVPHGLLEGPHDPRRAERCTSPWPSTRRTWASCTRWSRAACAPSRTAWAAARRRRRPWCPS